MPFGTTSSAVQGGTPLTGQPPAFMVDGADVERVTVEVAENSPAGTYVDDPLPKAIDPDNKDAKPVYSLADLTKERDDAKYFTLIEEVDGGDQTGDDVTTLQLRVEGPMLRDETGPGTTNDVNAAYDAVGLNHEGKKNTFMFLLKACESIDAESLCDELTVTVLVTDRNEAPSMPAVPKDDATTSDNNDPEFPAATATRTIAQGTAAGANIGAPITATDADADDTLTYTVSGSTFGIESGSGQLMTTAASEALAEDDYDVRVTVTDGEGGSDSVDVTITVGAGGVLGDADGNGSISRAEVIAAYRAYVNDGTYTRAEIIGIYRQYVSDAAGA